MCMCNSSREVSKFHQENSLRKASETTPRMHGSVLLIFPLSPSIRLWLPSIRLWLPSIRLWSPSIRWWSSAGAWHQLPSIPPLSSGDIAELWRTKLQPGHLAAFSTDCSHISKRASTFHVSATWCNVLHPFTFRLAILHSLLSHLWCGCFCCYYGCEL